VSESHLATSSETTGKQYRICDPDVRLMLSVRDDADGAFASLMASYQHRVLSLLCHMLEDRELAEDLAQDVFLRVYRARKRYEPRAKFSTWLFTIVNNVALNARRSRSRRREVPFAPASSDASRLNATEQLIAASSGQIPVRRLETAEKLDRVRQALAELNERQRIAVLLSKFEEMSYSEIGAVMGMTPMAIKSLLSRARENLRKTLSPYINPT